MPSTIPVLGQTRVHEVEAAILDTLYTVLSGAFKQTVVWGWTVQTRPG
jgi:hypothetical protein